MLLHGEWLTDDDGIERPTIRGEVLTADDLWLDTVFLVDTGADRTVLHSGLATDLGFELPDAGERYLGVGGSIETSTIPSKLRFQRSDETWLTINGPFPAFTDPLASDCSILGRDVLKLFTLIADPFTRTLTLIRDRHRYHVFEA
jgi:hypothetical protein